MRKSLICFGICAALAVGSIAIPATAEDVETVVTFGMGSAWADLVPYNGSSGGYYSGAVLSLLYDRLAYIDVYGNITPRAADSWEISDDKLSITFHLNEDATWSDGEPVTAEDFVFAVEMITDPDCTANQKSCYSILTRTDLSGNADGDELGAEAVDTYTLKYTFDSPISEDVMFPSYFLYYLALPEHLLSGCDPADYTTNELWNAPVGNGPCVFDSQIAGSELVLDSNESYHMGAPKFDKMKITVMAASNMASALMSGDLDMAYPPMSTDDIETMELADNLNVLNMDIATQPWMIIVNQDVYSDSRINKAIDLCIDRDTIAAMIGNAMAIESPILSSTKYYDESCTYTYDPETAKSLIEEAAADGAIDLSKPITICTPAGDRERVANVLQQNLEAIGVSSEIQVMEAATMFAGFYDGTTGIGLVNMTFATNPMYLRGMLTNDSASFLNIDADTWDDYYDSFMNAKTEEEEIEIVKQMQQTWLEEEPIIFYAATYEDYAYSTRFGDEGIGLEDLGYQNIPVWDWEIEY